MAQSPIKFFSNLDQVYPTPSSASRERTRWQNVTNSFRKTYGSEPSHIVRAPGRVNILGEHIDYSLFVRPVIPAAIEQDILIAISFAPSQSDRPPVTISNTSHKYESKTFSLELSNDAWRVAGEVGTGWTAYAKASIAEVIAHTSAPPVSMQWLVDGVIPEGAGLSSSAAFTVAAVISSLVANGMTDKKVQSDIVELALSSEHRLGLVNGGMDQAASVFCLPGQLLHLSFYPRLSSGLLPLPPSLAIVITNSLEPHALSESAPERYNLRVFENLWAVRLLLRDWKFDHDLESPSNVQETGRVWLREALHLLSDKLSLSEEGAYVKVSKDIERVLGADGKDKQGWTKEDIIQASGMRSEDFNNTFARTIEVRAEKFHLYKRARHTVQESLRVIEFHRVCEAAANENVHEATLIKLGELINASHASLRDDYDCTVDSVNTLQEMCLRCGSLGSRQTGGGWGGAVVSLVPVTILDKFLTDIKQMYPPYQTLGPAALGQAVFATAPGCGAGVFETANLSNERSI